MINRHSVDEKKGHVMSPPHWMGRASLISMPQLSRQYKGTRFNTFRYLTLLSSEFYIL